MFIGTKEACDEIVVNSDGTVANLPFTMAPSKPGPRQKPLVGKANTASASHTQSSSSSNCLDAIMEKLSEMTGEMSKLSKKLDEVRRLYCNILSYQKS